MDNYQIADAFSLLSKLMDIHGENSFKSKSYASAAFSIEKITVPLTGMTTDKIAEFQGIGSSTAQKISEMISSGKLSALEQLIAATPEGILQMLQIKGIGPKKIHAIWKEMEIETIGELLYACKENRLKLYKGFGEKTQQNIIDAIEFFLRHQGHFLYAEALIIDEILYEMLLAIFHGHSFERTGHIKRQSETIDCFEYVLNASPTEALHLLQKSVAVLSVKSQGDDFLELQTEQQYPVRIWLSSEKTFVSDTIRHSSSVAFWEALQSNATSTLNEHEDERNYFSAMQLPYIPAFLREDPKVLKTITKENIENIIQPEDIRGIIHSHSNWSDGSNSLEEMAIAAKASGLEYLVISDHSRSAFYAQGLSVERIIAQHKQIDELNQQLAPFKIFKSIESDILNDGSLDYEDDILARFDLVIASVHSNLKMDKEKAMMRLLKAIENPYTTILGHMTGRLLLSRAGYPVDHDMIIDACAKNNVAIELNAHPRRLDISWTYISKAIEKGVLISINPDAHSIEGMTDVKYGVWAAQKAMLTPHNNLSSFALSALETHLSNVKVKSGLIQG